MGLTGEDQSEQGGRVWKGAQCSRQGSAARTFLPSLGDPWDLLPQPTLSLLCRGSSVASVLSQSQV